MGSSPGTSYCAMVGVVDLICWYDVHEKLEVQRLVVVVHRYVALWW